MKSAIAQGITLNAIVTTPVSTKAILVPHTSTINVYANTGRAFMLSPIPSAYARAALDSRYMLLLENHIKEGSHLTQSDREALTENYQRLRELAESIFDKDGYFTDKIRPLSIETKLLTVGSKSDKMTMVGVLFSVNVNGDPNLCGWSDGIVWHFALPNDSGATWELEAGSFSMDESDKVYYIYVVAPKSQLGRATMLVTKDKLATEAGEHFNILAGVVNSVYNGVRKVTFTYGQTTIVGENITTGRIKGNNSNGLVIDLNTGEISGKITFLPGSPAQADINGAKQAAQEASSSVESLGSYLEGAFRDGVVDAAEAKAIEKYKAQVVASFNNLIAAYNVLYINPYLEGTPKTNLLNSKITLIAAKDALLSSITDAIVDGRTTPAEKSAVDAKFQEWDQALSDYNSKLETANRAIQDKLKSFSDGASEAAQAAQQAASSAISSAAAANSAVSDLGSYVEGSFKDGVISETEAITIGAFNKQVDNEYSTAINDYNVVFANPFLSGTAKQELLNAKISWSGAKDALQSSISLAIADGKTTAAEKLDFESKFASYSQAYRLYQTALSNANRAIQERIKGYSDEVAQEAAKALSQLSDMASDGMLSPVEKKDLVQRYGNILAEQQGLSDQAESLGVTDERDSYNAAITSLTDYLNTLLTPVAWSSLSGSTEINRDVFYPKFNAVYATRQALINRMFQGAKDGAERSAKDTIAKNLGYANFDELNSSAINGKTIVEGGKIRNNLIDTDALFAKEIMAKNMVVLGGKVGDFEIASKLIGKGYTNGVPNGNQVVLDPYNNEVVLSRNGVKRVRLTNSELTAIGHLKVDGGTIFCESGSASPVRKSSVLALFASRNDVGVGGDGVSRTVAVGVTSSTPSVFNVIAEEAKLSLQPAFYSIDLPYAINIVHSGDQHDGRFDRITGKNTCEVEVSLVKSSGVVSTYKDAFDISVDTLDTGRSVPFNRMARFNFPVSTADKYWMVVKFTVKGGERPIRYQSFNHGTWLRNEWWAEEYDWDVQYELSVNAGMSVDGSIGITEISNSGFQSVWTNHRYIRVDGNTSNPVFIESEGVWMHNGVEVKFDKNTITGYIDPTVYATRNYVDTGFVRNNGGTVAGDLTITGNLYLQQDGKYIVTEKVYSENDFITLRYNNPSLLAQGAYTGFEAKKVFSDGSDGYLVYGNDGMARVGKLSSLQTLATREDSPLDDGMAVWSTASKRFNSVAKGAITVGNADKLGGIAASSYIMYSPNKNTPYNHFAIGQVDGRNFIQSHNSQPLDLNPLGNLVYINGNESIHDGNILSKTAGGAYRLPNTVNYGLYNDNCLQYWNAASGDLLPTQSWWYNIRMAHGNADTYYSSHLAFDFFSDTIKYQRREGGTLKGWVNLWHSGNANRNTIDWTARDLYADAIYSSFIRSDNNVWVISRAGAAQNVLMGGLLVSNAYADVDKLPNNGIWSKGTIVSYSTLQAASRFGAIVIGEYDKSWNNAAYPTIRSTHPDGWFMLMNPHIPWRTIALGNVASSGSEGSFIRSEMPSGYWDAGVNKNVSDSYYAFNSNGVNRFNITTNGNVIMTGSTLNMYGSGSGVYNRSSIYALTSGFTIEAPLEADGVTANRLPLTLTWKGGYSDKGGMSLTTGGVRLRNLDLISDDAGGSGFTASGWRIGNYSNLLNLDVRGRLQVYEFIQNKINITNGNMLVTDSAKVDSVWFWTDGGFTGTGQHVRYIFSEPHPFNVGDLIRCQSNGKYYLVMVGYVDENRNIFDAYNAYNGPGVSSSAAKDLLVRWSSTDPNRKGLLYLNSSDTNNPNFQVIYNEQVKAQLGNVAGLMWMGSALPANTYGVWVDNGYFSGAINANSGNIAGWSLNSYEIIGSNGTYTTAIGKGYGIHNWRNSDASYSWKLNADGSGMLARGAITWDSAGNFAAHSGYIGGWVIDGYYLKSVANTVVMNSNIASIWVSKPAGGHVMLGQTYVNGAWTGKYGFSATNVSNQELVRFDDEVNRIAGWTITPWELNNYNGSGNGVVLHSSQGMGTITGWGSTWTNQLRIDGSGMLARNNISWDAAGNVTFADNVKVQWENYNDNNLCRYKNRWRVGNSAHPFFDTGYGSANGSTNTYVVGNLPNGSRGVVLRMQGTNSIDGNGGWDWMFPNIDTSYTYRYSVWVYREGSGGTIYHGCDGGRILTINGNAESNPYMYYSSLSGNLNGWYLIVGYVNYYGYSSSNANPRSDAGVYNTKGEKIANALSDFKWKDANAVINAIFRSYLYYGGDNSYSYFYAPALHKCDGSEPTIRQMVDTATGRTRTTQIDANGIYTGTLTAQQVLATNAVFSSANIADASITSAKIASLDVSKLTGTLISGKVFVNRDDANSELLRIGDGNIYTYSNGKVASQFNRGELTFYDGLGVPAVFVKNSAVSLSSILNSSNFSVTAPASLSEGQSANSSSFDVVGSNVGAYSASVNVDISATCNYDTSPYVDLFDYECVTSITVTANVYLYKFNGVIFELVGLVGSSSWTSNGGNVLLDVTLSRYNQPVNASFTISTAGTYMLQYSVTASSYSSAAPYSGGSPASIALQSRSATVTFKSGSSISKVNNGVFIGTNGVTIYRKEANGEEKYMSIDATDAIPIKVKCKTDMPGVLLSGKVIGYNTLDNPKTWGAKSVYASVQRLSQGYYRVWHYIGHQRYTCHITATQRYNNFELTGIPEVEANDYVDVKLLENENLRDGTFNFLIVGYNY